MTAQIGAEGLDLVGEPRPELLAEVARVEPQPGGGWVDLGRLGFRSTQRLGISDLADGVVVATWPAELAPQARHLYGRRLGSPLVAVAIERGWTVEPSPQLAFHTAAPAGASTCVRRLRRSTMRRAGKTRTHWPESATTPGRTSSVSSGRG